MLEVVRNTIATPTLKHHPPRSKDRSGPIGAPDAGRHSLAFRRDGGVRLDSLPHRRKLNPPNPSIYLMVIGVEPEFQGQGIGSRLLQVGLNRADDERRECFLETVTAADVEFYKKHNFDVVLNRGFGVNSQYWLMTRAPLK